MQLKQPNTHKRRFAAIGLSLAMLATACDYFHVPFVGRIDAPVVLTGADIPLAQGTNPDLGVGYRRNAANTAWVQIPIQVDERHSVDFGSQPNNNTQTGVDGTVYGNGNSGVSVLQYSDPNTFVGADPDATFDADDELAFMARDAGPKAVPGIAPPSGTTGSGLELTITDPVSANTGFVYLYVGTAGADPSAGLDYVDYTFSLNSGDYKTTYKRASGPNPESSTVTGQSYTMGFSDRWIHDSLAITDGSGVDILDGHKSQFALGSCSRSNVTFADAEGAFVANIDGPVRGIRSYIGANSGPLTQRTFLFYRDRYEMVTDLRVHAISSIISFVDLSSAAVGMEYSNSEMAGTVTVDGSADSVPSAVPDWSYVTGPQGNLLASAEIATSIGGLTTSTLYLDNDAATGECWGDGDYYGAAGLSITGGFPNTDPRVAGFESFQSREVFGLFLPGLSAAGWAPVWHQHATTDVVVTSSAY